MRFLLVVAVVLLTLGAAPLLTPAMALAAAKTPTLAFLPSPAYVGNEIEATACGLAPGHWYGLAGYLPGNITTVPDFLEQARAGDNGCFLAVEYQAAPVAGLYENYLTQCSAKSSQNACLYGAGGKLVADVDFTVLP